MEYACRAGTTTPFYFGETITVELANYKGNRTYGSGPKGVDREETTDVGSFPPNAFGLYDMHGNVWEWCQDVWHRNYNGAPTDGSAWESGGGITGGTWRFSGSERPLVLPLRLSLRGRCGVQVLLHRFSCSLAARNRHCPNRYCCR